MKRLNLIAPVLGFVFTLFSALFFDWQAKDLIWGLWISSLTVGFTTILTILISNISQGKGILEKVLYSINFLFGLVFFTIHFGMFHFVHSVFLNAFFPIVDPENFDDFFTLYPGILILLVIRYWPFIVASFAILISSTLSTSENSPAKHNMFAPYANVIRMHILIFVFAGLSILELSNYAIYPVLIFYFVPWSELFSMFRGKKPQ